MPRISTCTDTITDDTNVPTKNDKYPWLDPEDKRRHMTDAEILRLKLNKSPPNPIVFNYAVLNSGGHYNVTSGIYTVPLDGVHGSHLGR